MLFETRCKLQSRRPIKSSVRTESVPDLVEKRKKRIAEGRKKKGDENWKGEDGMNKKDTGIEIEFKILIFS